MVAIAGSSEDIFDGRLRDTRQTEIRKGIVISQRQRTVIESASALKNEIAVGSSPRALAVLPVCGSDGRKTVSAGMKTSEPVTSTRAVTWAEIVSR